MAETKDPLVKIRHWGDDPGQEKAIKISWHFFDSPFGEVLLAGTLQGICFMAFSDNRQETFEDLKRHFPGIPMVQSREPAFENAMVFLSGNFNQAKPVFLHLRGTPFQLKVWERLLQIPSGQTTTYGALAREFGNIRTARAIGGAAGSNPVAVLVPCHRVVQANGKPGHYRWGAERKKEILRWEMNHWE